MTDHHQDHLDDDVLSAVLDGEATAAESAHADTCAECGARIAALRGASHLVRTPVPPPDADRREAAIAAALAAALSRVVSLQDRRRRTFPTWIGAAAAAVVAVVAIGALVNRTDDGASTASDDSAPGGSDVATTAADEAEESASALRQAVPVDGGDLGAIEDVDLQAAMEAALGQASFATPSAESDAADTTMAAGDGAPAAGTALCEDAVRGGDPELGALVWRASGTYEGTPVEVLGFDVLRDDGAIDRRVYVLAVEGCAIRLSETYAA